MAGRLVAFPVRIANGASASSEIDLSDHRVVGVVAPAAWTAADLTFLGRPGKNTNITKVAGTDLAPRPAATSLGGIVGSDGTLLKVVAAALAVDGQYVALTGAVREGLDSVKIVQLRSTAAAGTAAVNQGGNRDLWLICEPRGV